MSESENVNFSFTTAAGLILLLELDGGLDELGGDSIISRGASLLPSLDNRMKLDRQTIEDGRVIAMGTERLVNLTYFEHDKQNSNPSPNTNKTSRYVPWHGGVTQK
jgi:hypothetical protein